jgi:hypothetical protein
MRRDDVGLDSRHDAIHETTLPQSLRLQLGHALVEHTARVHKVKLLHIKGYAVEPGLYRRGRDSSDIDVLVHPLDVEGFMEALNTSGWKAVTGFKSGSMFNHAATLWHNTWGYIDVHRKFPGVSAPPSAFFEDLWYSRTTQLIADISCTVPDPRRQALLIILHAGRDSLRGAADVRHLKESLPAEAWRCLESDASNFGADLAFAAATGRLAEFQDHPEHDVWAAVSRGSTRMQLLRARARAARTVPGRLRIIVGGLLPNRDHLRMALQREPKLGDYVTEMQGRFREGWLLITTSGRTNR